MKPSSFLCISLFTLSANLYAEVNAQVSVNDSLALVDLYNSTNGPKWINHTNWLTKAPVNTWYGIIVTGTRVTAIDLNRNKLNGTIPPSIGNLSQLQKLSAAYNTYLKDSIPTAIGKLAHLVSLDLSGNHLSNRIPASIGNLANLVYLDLHANKLSGFIPYSIGNLTHLGTLILRTNNLRGTIPSSIGNLINLQILDLNWNILVGPLPASIGNLKQLSFADLSFNQLGGSIPFSIGNLQHLQQLILSENELNGIIPFSIGKLINLQYLDLYNNQLSGAIPASIGKLINLVGLYLNANRLSGPLPATMGNLAQLQELFLSENRLSGDIPATFKKLKRLNIFAASGNQLAQSTNVDPVTSDHLSTYVDVSFNHQTFNGLEFLASHFIEPNYSPQALIPIHQHENTLAVSAGGTLSKNTYHWFKVGEVNSTTIQGDSTFTPSANGKYYAHVTNVIATALTLYTDTFEYTVAYPVLSKRVQETKHAYLQMFIYPNPANSMVNIQSAGMANMLLINSVGKVVLTETMNGKGQINVSSFANGTYYLQNKTTGETQKIIIVH